jgi:methylisocitrate lyase
MLHTSVTPTEKRVALRQRLERPEILVLPGAFSPATAMLIERRGFEAVYVSGAVLAADLGLPDVGLTTATEVVDRAREVSRVTSLPTLVDADTGFGEPMNVARTVQLLEDAGVAGLHVEDQVNPKRCGHLDGKQVVDVATAVRRLRAIVDARRDPGLLIVARTDARSVSGLDDAIDRARAYVDAGADAVFPEALLDESEVETFRREIDVPLLVNATEFGQGPQWSAPQLEALGVDMVIFPVSLLRLAMGAALRGLDALANDGSMGHMLTAMQTRAELYDLLDYQSYGAFDASVFNFEIPT